MKEAQEKEESWWLVIGGPKSALACRSETSKRRFVGDGKRLGIAGSEVDNI